MKPIMSKSVFSKIKNLTAIAIFLLVLFYCSTFWGFCAVPTDSMAPTINPGQFVIYESITAENLDYGDIVLFIKSNDETLSVPNFFVGNIIYPRQGMVAYTKRVVGFAGDVIEVHDGYLWRNGEKQIEDYVSEGTSGEFEAYTVPEGYIFCMGDNRNVSLDSRYFGAFPQNVFYGRAKIILPSIFSKKST